jgi:AraC family transcriptional regulator
MVAVLLAMTNNLDAGSPAGRLYGESLANALAVYLLNRYTVRRYTPVVYQGGLPGYRLKRVLDHIGDNLAEDLSLTLAAVAGMRPHYFAELFKRSAGFAPHRYVLLQRIERTKQDGKVSGVAPASTRARSRHSVGPRCWGMKPISCQRDLHDDRVTSLF